MMELDTKRLSNLATRLAKQRAIHECPEQMKQDLEMAAWEKYLTLHDDTHLWKDLYYAMLEELSRWSYQCKRGRGKNRLLRYKQSLYDKCTIRGKGVPIIDVLV